MLLKSPTVWLTGGLAIAGLSGWLYYTNMQDTIATLKRDNTVLQSNQQALKDAVASEKEVLERTKEQYDVLLREYKELQVANEEAEVYSEQLLKLLTKHDLEYLALRKPGLIENRINNATKNIFADIESITTN